jgi:acyl carrier protein
MTDLIQKLKQEIIEVLNLEDMKTGDIDENLPLFVDGLGLDSIDALELIVLLDKKYGIKIETAAEGKKILYSVRTMADYIIGNQKN